MRKLLDIYFEAFIITVSINRFAFTAFCTEYHTCSATCYKNRRLYTSCFTWFWSWSPSRSSGCSRYETVAYACTKMCQKRFCCDGYTGENCEQVSGSRYVRIVTTLSNSTTTNSTSNSTTAGTLQIYEHGKWMIVCARDWNDLNTDVACRTIGYKSGIQLDNLEYLGSSVTQWKIICQGNETDLRTCTKNEDIRIGNDTCTSAVTISCQTDCKSGYFGKICKRCDCNSKYTQTCDSGTGECYCKDGWTSDTCSLDLNECDKGSGVCPDEMICTNTVGSYSCACKIGYLKVNDTCQEINGSYVRLAERKVSEKAVEGRLQVYHGKEWTSVCSLNWDMLNTHISCWSLGFLSGIIWGTTEVSGRTGHVRCTGNESDIGLCVFPDDYQVSTVCTKAVYLFCSSVCREGFYGENCSECFCTNATKLQCDKEFGTCSCKRNGFTVCNTDLDECEHVPGACAQNMNCINNPGSYECFCKDGYVEDHGTCKGNASFMTATVGALTGGSVITISALSVCFYFFMKRKTGFRTTSEESSIRHVEIVQDTQPATLNDQYDTIEECIDNCSFSGGYAEIGSVISDIALTRNDSSSVKIPEVTAERSVDFFKITQAGMHLDKTLSEVNDDGHEMTCYNYDSKVSADYIVGRVAENVAVENDIHETDT
ncbi:fibrillin-2-like [Mercenaria mercenaria]|uniref:fibrillin-2-like n=1 Tax=Mercenaria mercenaria TaxID=6596 RepID=UPI00234E85E2|nr:fibrillin-2-like [Mercenaria mercenaria]